MIKFISIYRSDLDDKIMVNNIIIRPEKKIYVLLNKPKDFITTRKDTHERKIVFDLIKGVNERVFPVGRLDRNTTGLLLFTNDGDIAKKLTHPSYKIKKIYSVRLEKKITNQEINKIKNGYSFALMVDQRVSEGPRYNFFNKPAHTTIIPAQLALKYNCKLVPISLRRKENNRKETLVG